LKIAALGSKLASSDVSSTAVMSLKQTLTTTTLKLPISALSEHETYGVMLSFQR